MITWKNVSANRIIFAGTINVVNNDRLSVEDQGKRMFIHEVGEHDDGVFVCTVEAEEQIFLEHRLNVLSKWPVKETCFMYLSC